MYAPFGVVEKPGAELLPRNDKGRFMVTNTPSDEYVFKVPTLRNIALTAPYFHTGAAWDLRQAVAVMGASQLGIQLTSDEADKITAFPDGGAAEADIPDPSIECRDDAAAGAVIEVAAAARWRAFAQATCCGSSGARRRTRKYQLIPLGTSAVRISASGPFSGVRNAAAILARPLPCRRIVVRKSRRLDWRIGHPIRDQMQHAH
jgi:hypothetical protein